MTDNTLYKHLFGTSEVRVVGIICEAEIEIIIPIYKQGNFLTEEGKNLDVSCLELVMGIGTPVKIFSNFCTQATGIK